MTGLLNEYNDTVERMRRVIERTDWLGIGMPRGILSCRGSVMLCGT